MIKSMMGVIRSRRYQRLGREFSWIGLGQVLTVLGGMVAVRLLTQVLSPARYGELALGLTVGGLANQLAFGPLQMGVLRFWGPALEANELRACLAGVWGLLARSSVLVLGIAGLLVMGLAVTGQTAWIGLAATAFLLALISGYERALDAMQSAARQRAVTAWHQALAQWLRFLFALGLMALLGAFSSVAMMGYVLATAVVLLSQFVFFRRRFSRLVLSEAGAFSADTRKWAQRIREYAWPFATWGLFLWIQQSSDRWALQAFGQTRDVGYYSVLYQLGYGPIIVLTGIIVQFLQPILFARAGDGTDPFRVERARRLNLLVMVAFLVLTMLGAGLALALHAQVFAVLVAPEYRGVSLLLPWMVLSGGLFASSEVTALLLMSGVSTRILMAPKIGTAVLGVILNVVGAHWFGLRGVVLASVGFSSALLIWMLALSRSVRGARMSTSSQLSRDEEAPHAEPA
ncbi:MAG: lipopolysaccharide biosynthesis protein [Candidatus Binatia bacterium]